MTDAPTGGAPRPPAADAAIHVVRLTKRFGAVAALDGLTMTVPRGEIFGFLGPNGAGKTTAVKLLLGLTFPTSGEGYVLGAPMGDRLARRRIGYLPELFRYQDWMTAREVLALHCVLVGVPAAQRAPQIDAILETVGLGKRAADRVGTYSKGMQQRLGLAVALVGDPRLILLDEPTSALDPVGRREVRDVLRGLRARGVTVFLNSHLLTEVEHVCDRVAIVDRGKVVSTGTLSQLRGGDDAVRIRVQTRAPAYFNALARLGDASEEDGAYVVRGIAPERVPDAVAALVACGARVLAVEPNRTSLEDRFLQVLKGSADAAARDR